MTKERIATLRVHLIFAIAIAGLLIIEISVNMSSGQTVAQAAWTTVKQVRPFEWMMIILWWYAFTFPPKLDRWNNRHSPGLGLTEAK